MASITKKPNGSYVIRIQTGKKITGGYSSISKVFWPSKPNLSYAGYSGAAEQQAHQKAEYSKGIE